MSCLDEEGEEKRGIIDEEEEGEGRREQKIAGE
jgi:hypothetical protein